MATSRLLPAAAVLLAVSTVLAGCLLIAGRFQTLALTFETEEAIAPGESLEVHSSVYSKALRLRKYFVRIEGVLSPPVGSVMPTSVDVDAVAEDLESGKVLLRFKVTVKPDESGRFSATKRYKKDITAGTLQRVTVTPRGAGIPAGSEITVCVDVVKNKGELADRACAVGEEPTGDGEVFIVTVKDNEFDPKRVRVEPGDTVRWVFDGLDTSHTTTEMNLSWDSGFTFTQNGDSFEWTPAEEHRDLSFPYSCITHRSCCQMTGAVLVGRGAPDPGDEY